MAPALLCGCLARKDHDEMERFQEWSTRDEADEEGQPKQVPKFVLPLKGYMIVVTIVTTIISTLLTGVVAYGVYVNAADDAKLFIWPHPVSGDVLVTCIVVSTLTWMVGGQLCLHDVEREFPMMVINKPAVSTDPGRRLKQRVLHFLIDSHSHLTARAPGGVPWFLRLARTLLTGALVGLATMPLVGPLFIFTVGFLILDDKWDLWTLIYFKAVEGTVLSLIITPLVLWTATAASTKMIQASSSASTPSSRASGSDSSSSAAESSSEV